MEISVWIGLALLVVSILGTDALKDVAQIVLVFYLLVLLFLILQLVIKVSLMLYLYLLVVFNLDLVYLI